MEAREGNVRVGTVPYVTIGDKHLDTCKPLVIQRELLALVKKIGEQREEIIRLKKELDDATTK